MTSCNVGKYSENLGTRYFIAMLNGLNRRVLQGQEGDIVDRNLSYENISQQIFVDGDILAGDAE